ncbi:restriction endonuclease subunit S [Leptospira santarosai]|uniref:restriction endonuclease subunit S n=1 Tax=Leptospira santarosai TaxID=28183 RepID=UPI0024AF0A43|nr:restriction endonuclease subunit S [Leptospira santarosai]MDI7157159.1 restriction endonuclease subunit S [Leptospira santarosai]
MEKLLDGASVEWKMLGETLVRTKGTNITAGQMKELDKFGAPLKVFAGGRTVAFVNFEDIPAKDVNREPSIIVKSRGVIEFEYYDKPFSHKNEMWSYHSKNDAVDIKFVYYFLRMNEPYFQNLGSKMQMPQIATPDTDKFQIPIPPLPVQVEIVRILDAFTELTAELTARKKQYNYYRDQLLSFEEVEWKTLEEIFDLRNGYTPSKANSEYWEDGTIPWFRMEDIRENGQILNDALQKVATNALKGGKLFPANSIIVATSATIGEHALITVPYLSNQRFTNLILKTEYNDRFEIKFLFYYCFLLDDWCKNNTTVSSFASVDMNGFRKFQIPIPSLAEQKRIVAILDKFDALTSSISEGLPREIELRQKQYEYYRELLLSFPKPDGTK